MASAACRRIAPAPALTLEVHTEQNPRPATLHQVCRDLEQLCEMGLLEAFRDEYNIVRYRTTGAKLV
ncbi:MAG TPA: hypothetical protein VGM18_05065 [Candidatus Sulfotelmatobacter sp.]|jgi:hypothetical protein